MSASQVGGAVLQACLLLGGAAGVANLVNVLFSRRKLHAEGRKVGAEASKVDVDATAVLTGEALKMVREARDQAQEARSQADRCNRRVNALEQHMHILEKMIRDLGGDPPPFVFDWTEPAAAGS